MLVCNVAIICNEAVEPPAGAAFNLVHVPEVVVRGSCFALCIVARRNCPKENVDPLK